MGVRRASRGLLPTALAAVLLVTGCSSSDSGGGEPSSEPGSTSPSATPSEEPPSSAPPPAPPSPSERLGLRTGWGPTQGELDRAARLAQGMPLPDLAGQLIVAAYSGTAPPTRLVTDLHLGGVIAFTENVVSPQQIAQTNAALTEAAGRDWPLFLSVDQEGGIVERVEGDATRFPTFMSTGAADDAALTRAAARASGAELRGLGFTVDFAPDADVTAGPTDPTIGSRSAGSDPQVVATQAVAAAEGYLAGGVVPVVKHFPGHGSVTTDSHTTLPVQAKTLAQLEATDLVPFRQAVAAGLPAVMVGHLDVRAVDPGVPSSVSRRVVTGLLRHRLGFDGLVLSDSLQMAGVADTRDSATSAVEGIRAGLDLLLMPPDPVAARAGLIAAVQDGRLSRRRLEQSAARQIALLLHVRGDRGSPVGSGAPASAALSRAAVTVVAGPCSGRLVGDSVTPVGDPEAVAAFLDAAAAAGLSVGGGDTVGFTGYLGGVIPADVLVAVDTPYVLGEATAPVRIATYGDTPGAMTALVDVLLGRARAPGRLPVAVSRVTRPGC